MVPDRARLRALAVLIPALWLYAGTAAAFDTGPHFDITEDVLASEGFAAVNIKTVQAANFMVDFYEFMGKEVLAKAIRDDCLSKARPLLKVADAQHFDDLLDAPAVAKQWDTMLAATKQTAQALEKKNDVLSLLALLGASLHNVQDFYAHSNWVEMIPANPKINGGILAAYGSHPTWLSVDRKTRESLPVYTLLKSGNQELRTHGDWNSNEGYLNQDWEGRPHHRNSYICAQFATRQWVRLFQTFVSPATWTLMRSNYPGFDPSWDWEQGARKFSFYGGHWNGNGGPTGKDAFQSKTAGTSPDLLLRAATKYMNGTCPIANATLLRTKVAELLMSWGAATYQGPVDPALPSAAPENLTFVRLRVHRVIGIDPGDGFAGDKLDWFCRARIAGQRYWSGLIDEHNEFDFDRKPYAPWAMTKAIVPASRDEELTSLVVVIRTGADDGAGTDDDVFLRLSDKSELMKLEFPYYDDVDDFERGSSYTYAFDIPGGIRIKDIEKIQIEKPSNGKNGEWQVAGITVLANGREIYANRAINTRLTGQQRSWTAPDFRRSTPMTADVPIRLDIMELDYDKDDHMDVNPLPGAKGLGFQYATSAGTYRGDVTGKGRVTMRGRGDSDPASIDLAVEQYSGSCRK